MHAGSLPFFNGVPGPSPWYLTPNTPAVHGFSWRSAGSGRLQPGKTLLAGPGGPVAILDFQNYVMPLDPLCLLIWHQSRTENAPSAPVRLHIVQPNLLSALGSDLDLLYKKMNTERLSHIFGGDAIAGVNLSTFNAEDNLRADFPSQLQVIDELLILCNTSAKVPTFREGHNLALLVANPKQGVYRLYAQDWFNTGPFDFMYQWVSRVARNPATGRIHGEGIRIRIRPFVLDDSLRRLRAGSGT